MKYLLALDQGTSSSRSIVFAPDGHIVAMAQREFEQIYPQPGWVEHNPLEIWSSQLATLHEVLKKANLQAHDIVAAGITNQRETTVVWHRETGQPIYNAIVWQDRRAENICQQLREQGHALKVQEKTGLLIDAYFSGTKLQWMLDNVPHAREWADAGKLAFGTVDTWLIWQLTHGKVHATDVSNASRTMLFNVHTNQWDDELLALLRIPKSLMPEVHPSSSDFGTIEASILGAPVPIGGVAGDQQSALFGQTCWTAGQAKNTYGTGCFALMHTGSQFLKSQNGLITTSAAQVGTNPEFALEGSVFIGGAVVQWLRDGLHAFEHSSDVQALAQSVGDSGGVVMVPAFTGLGAPYWQAQARGAIVGITRGTTMAHLAYAALESIAFQSTALLQAMSLDSQQNGGLAVQELRVDGGACANDLLMQMQADLLGIPVVRPAVIETTALGAAYLAGLHSGLYADPTDLSAQWRIEKRFEPQMSRDQAQHKMNAWDHAVRQTMTA
jgi:glycerol kinase